MAIMQLSLLLNLLFVSSLNSHLAGDDTTPTPTTGTHLNIRQDKTEESKCSLNSLVTPGPNVVGEYITPLGPGVKPECLAASNRYLDLLNVSET